MTLSDIKKRQLELRKIAMKEKTTESKVRVNVLSTLIGHLENIQDDSETTIFRTVDEYIKNNKEMIDVTGDASAKEKAQIENDELMRLKPASLSEDEVVSILRDYIQENGIDHPSKTKAVKDFWEANYNGQFESKRIGALASKLIKEQQ